MEFTKNFKAAWWFILVLILSYYLYGRLDQLQSGSPSWFDALAFLVWVALGIGPFYAEIELPGLKLKQEVSKLKEHVTSEIASIKTTIRQSAEQQQVTHVNFPHSPPPDAMLPNIEQQVKRAMTEYMGEQEDRKAEPSGLKHAKWMGAPPDSVALFNSRYALETRLRELYREFGPQSVQGKEPVNRIVRELIAQGLLSKDLAGPILEIYSICSAAIHGEDLSSAKIDFVKNTVPDLTVALDSILESRPPLDSRWWSVSPGLWNGVES